MASRSHAAALAPGRLGRLQFIGHLGRHETDLFIRKHIFPGGWNPSLADVLVEMECAGQEVFESLLQARDCAAPKARYGPARALPWLYDESVPGA